MIAPAPPPQKKRRRGGFVASLSAALSVLMFGLLAIIGLIVFVQRQLQEPGPLTADKIVLINKGDGTEEVADTLRREGVISYPYVFIGAVYTRGLRLKAGEYQFRARASLSSVIETLVEGKAILHTITLPEGLTSEQIVARLVDSDILMGEVREIPREGSLLPDTYKVQRGTSREQILAMMAQAQKRILNDIWVRRSPDLPIKTATELVTLASIVEKETGKADERTRVAGVFINRLQKRMRLQSDPTIVYGIVGGKGTLGRGILRSEIQTPTAYNTYTIDGLPPGPIANPGRASLEAVANPSRTRDLFFVADGTGGHVFAETYEQHQRNVAKWRQIEASRRDGGATNDRVESVDAPNEPVAVSPSRENMVAPPASPQPVPALPKAEPKAETGATGIDRPTTQSVRPSERTGAEDLSKNQNQINKPVPMLPLTQTPQNSGSSQTSIPVENAIREPNRSPAARTAAEAVEGTNKDPLLNKTFDLNSSKSVPTLRP
jgi:UPF0755 protein